MASTSPIRRDLIFAAMYAGLLWCGGVLMDSVPWFDGLGIFPFLYLVILSWLMGADSIADWFSPHGRAATAIRCGAHGIALVGPLLLIGAVVWARYHARAVRVQGNACLAKLGVRGGVGAFPGGITFVEIYDPACDDRNLERFAACLAECDPGRVRVTLADSRATGAGLVAMAGKLRVTELALYGSRIDDGTLAALAGLEHLERLGLYETSVTAGAVEKLRQVRPELEISRQGTPTPALSPRDSAARAG